MILILSHLVYHHEKHYQVLSSATETDQNKMHVMQVTKLAASKADVEYLVLMQSKSNFGL